MYGFFVLKLPGYNKLNPISIRFLEQWDTAAFPTKPPPLKGGGYYNEEVHANSDEHSKNTC
jgi:hypothetical protein